MSERFTAPVAGWYYLESGQQPRLLTDEEAAAAGEPRKIGPHTQVVHFEQGDVLMNSTATLPAEAPSFVVERPDL